MGGQAYSHTDTKSVARGEREGWLVTEYLKVQATDKVDARDDLLRQLHTLPS